MITDERSRSAAGSRRLWINQTIAPDYRLPVFRGLRDRLGTGFKLSCGGQWSSAGMNSPVPLDLVSDPLYNRWLLGRRLLWQDGLAKHWATPGLAIFEFNLRAPSTWLTVHRRARVGLPVAFWGHTSGRSRRILPTRIRAWLLDRAYGFICYTETQAAALRAERPAMSVIVAPNAVMHACDCWTPARDISEVRDVIYVGRMIREKKPELAIRGFAAARSAGMVPMDSRLLMVGEGPRREMAEALARSLRIPCEFFGHVSDVERLRLLYSTALVSLSPGYVGLSATQSLAFGVPILVARDEPHSPEIETCVDGQTATFFDCDSADGLAVGMQQFFRRQAEWVSKRPTLASAIAVTYSYEKMIDAFTLAISAFAGTIGESRPNLYAAE